MFNKQVFLPDRLDCVGHLYRLDLKLREYYMFLWGQQWYHYIISSVDRYFGDTLMKHAQLFSRLPRKVNDSPTNIGTAVVYTHKDSTPIPQMSHL